ncbi:MAG: hypothetical protein HUJ25_07700 [Crocinitomicaceae bacterium]|nr:hypothetical protein [Crocinitomicaceae bacterium]
MTEISNGFILVFDEGGRSWRIQEYLETNRPFSEGLSSEDFKPKGKEIFIISLNGNSLDYLCLGTRKKRVLTLKNRVEFTDFIKIQPELEIGQIAGELDKSIRSHFIRTSSGQGQRIPPKTWEKLLKYIRSKRPELSEKIDRLIEKKNQTPLPGKSRRIEVFKRDATTTALSFADIDSRKAKFSYSRRDDSVELPPFLKGLSQDNLIEDRMLEHDSKIFGNWDSLPVPPSITAQFREGEKILTINNFNRRKVEETLGVDLIYYNHHYNSYVLVQYKRLSEESDSYGYRPIGKTYEKEFNNMTTLENGLKQSKRGTPSLLDYRFHHGLCYFKLCEPKVLDFSSTGMIKGMYFPLDYWTELVQDEQTSGKKGGKIISYENAGRYFNNSQFVPLVRDGWIGSNSLQTSMLTQIIEQILDSNRSLILAEYFKGEDLF